MLKSERLLQPIVPNRRLINNKLEDHDQELYQNRFPQSFKK
jgi:hypothetical protein